MEDLFSIEEYVYVNGKGIGIISGLSDDLYHIKLNSGEVIDVDKSLIDYKVSSFIGALDRLHLYKRILSKLFGEDCNISPIKGGHLANNKIIEPKILGFLIESCKVIGKQDIEDFLKSECDEFKEVLSPSDNIEVLTQKDDIIFTYVFYFKN